MNILQTLAHIHKKTSLSWWQFWLLCLFFMSFSFGQLGRVELGRATFYLHDAVILIWLATNLQFLVSQLSQTFSSINLRFWWAGWAFVAWLVLGMVISFFQTGDMLPLLYLGRLTFYMIFLFSLFSQLKAPRLLLRILLVSSGIYMVWFGLLQYFFIPDTRYLEAFGWDEHYFRLIGPLLDPNLSGILYVIIGWLIVSLRRLLPRSIWLPSLILTVIAIVLTYSRATYVAAGISIVFFFWITKATGVSLKKLLIALALLICGSLLVYYAAPKPGGDGVNLFRTTSIIARFNTTQLYIDSLQPYQWITGSGFYSLLPTAFPETHARVPDNFIVLLLVNTGIVGLVLFFTFFTKLFRFIVNWERETLAALIAVIIHAQLNNSLLEPFIFLAVGIAVISQLNHEKKKV